MRSNRALEISFEAGNRLVNIGEAVSDGHFPLKIQYITKAWSLIDIVAALGEFVGTTMFLFFAFTGTAVAKIPAGAGSSGLDISAQTYIALCFGFSLMVNVWIFYRVSGGLFNPAVSVYLMTLIAQPGSGHVELLAGADIL